MAVIATTVHAASPTSGGLILGLLLLDYFHDLIWYPQVFDRAASYIYFRQSQELVAVGAGLYYLFEREVHPCVAVDEGSVEGFADLELDEDGVADGSGEETEGKHCDGVPLDVSQTE